MSTDLRSGAPLQIFGGGPGGLAAAYYGVKAGYDLALYEGSGATGGNARTLKLGDCLFDTGAHRLHDKNPEVTDEIRNLLGSDLMTVNAPSRIHLAGRRLRFPLQPGDLLRNLPWQKVARIILERIGRNRAPSPSNFRDWAVDQYGKTLAELLLLNYSEKLWGEETGKLSIQIAGGRLRNLDLRAFLRGVLPGDDPRHLDGAFLYPRHGFGSIFSRVSEEIGSGRIHCENRITSLKHGEGRIRSFVVNGTTRVDARTIISTLPLNLTVEILDPLPPRTILETARSIRFRKLLLCVFCLKRPKFSDNASIYFPESEKPFTRLYECKNRSRFVAPDDQTAIVLELPCHETSPYWQMGEKELLDTVLAALNDVERVREDEVLNTAVYKLPFAYPILEVGIEQKVEELIRYLADFENFHLLGRNATFQYLHTHDLFASAKEMVGRIDL